MTNFLQDFLQDPRPRPMLVERGIYPVGTKRQLVVVPV